MHLAGCPLAITLPLSFPAFPSEHHQQSVAHSPRRWQANGVLPGDRELEVLIWTQPAAGGDTPTWSHPTLDTPHTGHTAHGHTPHWTHPTSVGSLCYLSHFRCVHRGAFFSQMRTTSVRKLLPEAWGFHCPVHTPDGATCGLLNHLAAPCQVCGRRGGRVVVCGGRGGASGCVGGVRG